MIDLEGANLVLELTRWCNMECWHCLRGPRQRKRMSKETLEAALCHFNYIDVLTFTGGEPTLAVDLMEYALEVCRYAGIHVGDIFIATNGSRCTKRFKRVFLEWLAYCDNNEVGGLRISRDRFHEWVNVSPWQMWWADEVSWRYENISLDLHGAPNEPQYLFDSGNAAGYGRKPIEAEWEIEDGKLAGSPMIYVSVQGDVLPTCNISYERQPEFRVCGVADDWEEAIAAWIKANTPQEELA